MQAVRKAITSASALPSQGMHERLNRILSIADKLDRDASRISALGMMISDHMVSTGYLPGESRVPSGLQLLLDDLSRNIEEQAVELKLLANV